MLDAVVLLGQFIGAFYIAAAVLAVRRLRFDWFLDRALEQLTLRPTGDKSLLIATTGFALLYGLAGLALLLRSQWSVWLLAAGLFLQAMFLAWRYVSAKITPAPSTVHAGGLSLLAFTLAAIALQAGKLS